MKTILLASIFIATSFSVLSQEKWGSYDGSIAGTRFTLVEACGDSVEVSPGIWYERMHITSFGFTEKNAGRWIVGDSVFFKYSLLDNSAPHLLYDFSLEIGDTTQTLWGEFVVTNVDSEFAVGMDRKRITMVSSFDGHVEVWLEGIGSNEAGYLQPGSPKFAPDAGSDFSCYHDERLDESYYGDRDPVLCMINQMSSTCTTSTPTDADWVSDLLIYPNPTHDYIRLDLGKSKGQTMTAQLFCMAGKRIVEETLASNNNVIDVSNLRAGVYLLEIRYNGEQSYHKIVIQ